MKKLLLYDIKKQKHKLMVLFAAMLFTFLMILLSSEDFIKIAVLMLLFIILILGYLVSFDAMFRTRFMKDDLLHYTSISSRVIIMEPVVISILYQFIIVGFLAVIFGFFMKDIPIDLLPDKVQDVSEYQKLIIGSFVSIHFFWTSTMLFIWSVMKHLEIKSTVRYELAYILVLGIGFGFIKVMEVFEIEKGLSILCMLSLSALLILLMYISSMRVRK